jgi:hypothetical protein
VFCPKHWLAVDFFMNKKMELKTVFVLFFIICLYMQMDCRAEGKIYLLDKKKIKENANNYMLMLFIM